MIDKEERMLAKEGGKEYQNSSGLIVPDVYAWLTEKEEEKTARTNRPTRDATKKKKR